MLTYLAALSSFALMIGIGILFRFLSVASAWLILLFALCSLLLRLFYRQASCRSLELKDFALALLFAFGCSLLFRRLSHPVDVHSFCYLYLCSFVGVVQYACSIRFKTLIGR